MPLQDLAGRFADLQLPYGGKVYAVPPPTAEQGLRLQTVMATGIRLSFSTSIVKADTEILSESEERQTFRDALGPAYTQMLADGVPWPLMKHAGMTALIHWTMGAEQAERVWNSAGELLGKAQAPAKKPKTSGSRGAKSTKPRASRGATTTPARTVKRAKAG